MTPPLPSYTTDRETARHSPKGTTLYPRLMVLGSTWVRQDYAGGPMEVVSGPVVTLSPTEYRSAS